MKPPKIKFTGWTTAGREERRAAKVAAGGRCVQCGSRPCRAYRRRQANSPYIVLCKKCFAEVCRPAVDSSAASV